MTQFVQANIRLWLPKMNLTAYKKSWDAPTSREIRSLSFVMSAFLSAESAGLRLLRRLRSIDTVHVTSIIIARRSDRVIFANRGISKKTNWKSNLFDSLSLLSFQHAFTNWQ